MIPTAVIIVAGGSGVRMGAALPKQFLPLKGRPILMHTIERFAEALPGCRIILVLPRSRTAYWQTLCEDHGFSVQHLVCEGGETRFDSVHNGLKLVGDADLVAIHDGVRPLVSAGLIRRAVADAEEFGAVGDAYRFAQGSGPGRKLHRGPEPLPDCADAAGFSYVVVDEGVPTALPPSVYR